MANLRKLEFFLLRYVPSALRGEYVNFGLIMFEPSEDGSGFAEVRFARSWDRIEQADGDADVDMLDAYTREIRAQLADIHDRGTLIRRMEESFSGVIEISTRRSHESATPDIDIEEMAQMYLEAPKIVRPRERSERQRILQGMDEAFERAGVRNAMMKNLAVSPYTKPGDPFKFDYAYRTGNTLKFFHAIPLRTNVDQALLLAARYPTIATGVERALEGRSALTAVVDDGLNRGPEEVRFALSLLEEQHIRVASVSEMAGLAEIARQEIFTS